MKIKVYGITVGRAYHTDTFSSNFAQVIDLLETSELTEVIKQNIIPDTNEVMLEDNVTSIFNNQFDMAIFKLIILEK